MRSRTVLMILAAALPSARIAAVAQTDLEPVPVLGLEQMEPQVRQQLQDALNAIGDSDGEAPSEPYGRLGQLLILYGDSAAAQVAFRNAHELEPETFDWLYYLGSIAHQQRDLDGATTYLGLALALSPGDLPSLLRLGQIELGRGNLDSARQYFEQATSVSGATAAVEAGLGRIAYLEGRLTEAADHYERALDLQPEATSLHYQLAIVLRESGESEGAERHLTQRGDREVSFPDPLGDELAGLVTGAGIHVSRAARARQRGDNAAALAAYRIALESDPANIDAREGFAATLAIMGRTEEARAELEEVIDRDPDSISALYNLGNLEASAGRLERAERLYARALELAPDYIRVRRNLATLLALEHRVDEALEQYDAVLRLDPTDLDARRERAALLVETGRVPEAVEDLRQVIAAAPAANDRLQLARLLGQLGLYEAAAVEFEQLLEIQPANAEASFGRGLSYLLAELYGEARVALEEGLDSSPASVPLQHMLARFLATCPDAGLRDGQAAQTMAQAVFEAEQTLEHAETLAMAYAEVGQFDQAVALQQRIFETVSEAGDANAVRAAERYLESYRAHRPVRAPWRGSSD